MSDLCHTLAAASLPSAPSSGAQLCRKCDGDSSIGGSQLTVQAWATIMRLAEGPALPFENSLGEQKGRWVYLHFHDPLTPSVDQARRCVKAPSRMSLIWSSLPYPHGGSKEGIDIPPVPAS